MISSLCPDTSRPSGLRRIESAPSSSESGRSGNFDFDDTQWIRGYKLHITNIKIVYTE